MDYLYGHASDMSHDIRTRFFNYRYKVFVERLGWELDTPFGHEADQFDHSGTVYVIARNAFGEVAGCARLLPTTTPYLLEQVFPQLLNGMPPPKSSLIWELSRFTTCDLNDNSPSNGHDQFSAELTIELLHKTIECARSFGAERIISVSPLGVERLLRKAGFDAHRAGPPMIIDGYPLFACWIELKNKIQNPLSLPTCRSTR